MTNLFKENELTELRQGLDRRGISYQIERMRQSPSRTGTMVRIPYGLDIWEAWFFDDGHIELAEFRLTGDVETDGVTAASILSKLHIL
jgi:hypothetical protein